MEVRMDGTSMLVPIPPLEALIKCAVGTYIQGDLIAGREVYGGVFVLLLQMTTKCCSNRKP